MSSLKLISPNQRINFLKLFAKEMILNLEKKETEERNIKIEKIKQKFLEPLEPEKQFQKINQTPVFQPKGNFVAQQPNMIPSVSQENKNFANQQINGQRNMINPSMMQPRTRELNEPQKIPIQRLPVNNQSITSQIPQLKINIAPESNQRPVGFTLGRLDGILNDQGIQSIECPGPGKNVTVKKFGKPQITTIVMNQQEIMEIINKFANNARIPVVGGILKAAVGDLIISAIISEFVGSRFIVNKIITRPTNGR
jgi:hypothetical protein